MPFPPAIRRKVLEQAHYTCCWCQRAGFVEAHHLIPTAENGPDSEENAVPLCPNCHAELGANRELRTAIRTRRDWWIVFCERLAPPRPEWLEIAEQMKVVATNEDLEVMLDRITSQFSELANQPEKNAPTIIAEMSSFSSTLGHTKSLPFACPYCRSRLIPEVGHVNTTVCQVCGMEVEPE